jgi:hypothetical protein
MKISPMNNKIRAISLWQPWAGGIALGVKEIETRSWPTKVRGDLVICSAKKKVDASLYPLNYLAVRTYFEKDIDLLEVKGYALCIVDIYDCIQIDKSNTPFGSEHMWGDYSEGRFGWKLRNVRRIKPVPIKGGQGFFYIDKNIIEEIK